jgi:hypothetical protein
MNLSQNSLFKADTYVRPVAEGGISGLVHTDSPVENFRTGSEVCGTVE